MRYYSKKHKPKRKFCNGDDMSNSRSHPKYEDITARWGGMDIRHEFSSRIDTWLSAFREDERPLLLNLLGHFFYYSEKKLKEKAAELYRCFCEVCQDSETVVYIPTIKKYGVGYSSLFFDNFWLVNNLYDQSERNILDLLRENIVPEKIAIVDDYSGTGNTIASTLSEMICANDKIKDSRVYIVVQHITKRAEMFLQSLAVSLSLDIQIIYLDFSEEIFKPEYIYEMVEAEKKRLFYESICARLDMEDNVLGYEQVQSLVAFYYNTPNNTLGLFWKDLDGFAALFARHNKRKTHLSELQRKARQQDNLRKLRPIVMGFDDVRTSAFLAYCVSKEKGFSYETALMDFGLTVEQLRNLLDSLLKQEYLVCSNGIFYATKKTKEISFRSRFKEIKKAFAEDYKKTTFNVNPDVSYIPTDF